MRLSSINDVKDGAFRSQLRLGFPDSGFEEIKNDDVIGEPDFGIIDDVIKVKNIIDTQKISDPNRSIPDIRNNHSI
jgi:hypothetical protein